MSKFEREALRTYRLKPSVWKRFIDDIFSVWVHGMEALLEFMSYLNSIDPRIQFTFKYSPDQIEFLDVLVIKESDGFPLIYLLRKQILISFYILSLVIPFTLRRVFRMVRH